MYKNRKNGDGTEAIHGWNPIRSRFHEMPAKSLFDRSTVPMVHSMRSHANANR